MIGSASQDDFKVKLLRPFSRVRRGPRVSIGLQHRVCIRPPRCRMESLQV